MLRNPCSLEFGFTLYRPERICQAPAEGFCPLPGGCGGVPPPFPPPPVRMGKIFEKPRGAVRMNSASQAFGPWLASADPIASAKADAQGPSASHSRFHSTSRAPRGRGDAPRMVSKRGSVKKKQVPSPGVLSTPMRPPWASIKCLAIARPRPDPSSARDRDLSAR